MNSPLRLGFLGGSIDSVVGKTHKIASQMDNRWKLVSGCFGQSKESNLDSLNAWNIDSNKIYTDWYDYLKSEKDNIDAVAILTPTPLHYEIALEAMKLKVPVICEKSIATSVKESRHLVEFSKSNSSFFAPIFNYSGFQMVREMRLRIQNGNLGRITQVQVQMPQDGFIRDQNCVQKVQEWRKSESDIPMMLLDLGTHVHQLIHFVCDEHPISVTALSNTYGNVKSTPDNFKIISRYSNEIDCQFWISKSAFGHNNEFSVQVIGEFGQMTWSLDQPEYLREVLQDGTTQLVNPSCSRLLLEDSSRYQRFKPGHPTGFIEAFANYYSDLADGLIEFNETGHFNNPWIPSIEVAHQGLLFLDAVKNASKNFSWQEVLKE